MTTRRSFLKTSALVSAGLLASGDILGYDKKYVGLELYSVRDYMQKDPAATLARIARIGYNSIEGTYTDIGKFSNVAVKDFATILKNEGLVMRSCHYRLGEIMEPGMTEKSTLLGGWDNAVEDADKLGLKYMVCSWLAVAERGTLDHYKKLAEDFNKAAEKCKKAGIQFCYHNHDFEFEKQNGKFPYDILMANTDKDLVKLELDMYWVSKAGIDPISLIHQHAGRFPLWHLKDMDNSPQHDFTEVGHGIIDFRKIFKFAKQAGLKYFYVEQDKCPGDPYDSIAQSLAYVKKNLI